MKPTPPGWPRISASLCYEDASHAIDWLCFAFGFEVRLRIENEAGRVDHSELVYGDGVIMIGSLEGKERRYPNRKAPTQLGGANTQNLMIYVDDVEAHCAQARAAGAEIVSELATTDYGEDYWCDRGYECKDPGGHHWWFFQRLRNPKGS